LPKTFLWIHYFDPHAPYNPPSKFRKADADPLTSYDGEIAFLDEQLGILLQDLEQRGFLKDTLTIVVSDHGEGFGEHGYQGHGWFLYDEVIRVPLLISGPGINPGRTRDLTQHVDLAPGILDYLGLPVPRKFQGISWWQVNQHVVAPRQRAWMERRLPPIPNATEHEEGEGAQEKWAMRTPTEKFIWSSDGKNEFYDLLKDPGEKQNLYESERSRAVELEHLGLLQKKELLHVALAPKADIQQQDEETREALKALGYVN
jgi:arylsulfatase A-like enzyme